jgi:peptide/nickel transport system substrate-binding protein
MTLRRIAAGFLAGLALAAAPPAAAQTESLIRVRLNADVRSTDPGVNRDGNTDAVMMHMVEGLVAFREDTSVGPMLAAAIEIAPDGLAYTFRLREGVRFHNGATLGSADVRFAWERYMRRETNWRCRGEFEGGVTRVVALETPDALTVIFRIDRPSALFLTTLARADCGAAGVYHRDSLNADGTWRAPVGTGPFRMGEWRRGQFFDLVRFADYSARPGSRDGHTGGKTALVDRVRFQIIPDSAAAKAALLAGSIDLNADVASQDVAEYRARPYLRVVSSQTMGLVGLLLQPADPVLRDVRIRRALALSLDMPEIVRVLTDGTSEYNASPIPVGSSFYGPAQREGFRRDLPAARRLLQEAGYRGQPIRILSNNRYTSMRDMPVLVQAMAGEAGIRVEFEMMDWATQLDRYTRGEHMAMAFAFSARLDPALSFEMFSGPRATQPRKLWDHPEVEALIRESMTVSNRERRQEIFDTLHRRFVAEVPMIALYNDVDITVHRANLSGFAGWAMGQPRLWGVRVN